MGLKEHSDRGLYWDQLWALAEGCTALGRECDFRMREDLLDLPLGARPRTWSIGTDLFHERVPSSFLFRAWAAMAIARRHRFLVCTERPLAAAAWYQTPVKSTTKWIMREAIRDVGHRLCAERPKIYAAVERSIADWEFGGTGAPWPLPNVAIGTTIGHQRPASRIAELMEFPAALRFLSIEPLLEKVSLRNCLIPSSRAAVCRCGHGHGFTRCENYGSVAPECHIAGCDCRRFQSVHGIGWAVIGCESGPRRRPCALEWVYDLVEQLRDCGARIWIKQLDLGGRVVNRLEDFPEDLRLRETPEWFFGKPKTESGHQNP
jgi:protein gp37